MTPTEYVLSKLDKVKPNGIGKWMACCPAHKDGTASLSITTGDDGRALLHCFAGCLLEEICAALLIETKDLFNDPEPIPKALPKREFDPWRDGKMVEAYDYRDGEGALLFQVVRFHPKDFRQRKPDGHGGWIRNLRGVTPVLYRLKAVLEAKQAGKVVVLCEGEKDAEAVSRLGFCGTTNPMGAGKWNASYTETLAGAHVVMLPDNDVAGRIHRNLICKELHRTAKSLRVVELPNLPEKGDVSDWLANGGTRETLSELIRSTPIWTVGEKTRVVSFSDGELFDMVIPAPKWAVPGLVPEGVTMLVGKPKIGKSFCVLDIAIGISQGTTAFGRIPVKQGEVLYLALEETTRRLQDRYLEMAGDLKPTGLLHFLLEFDPFGTENGRSLEDEIKKYPNLRLVIIDTLAKIRRAATPHGSVYKEDYEAIYDIKRISDTYGVSFLVVHHENKSNSKDPLDSVSGSTGLTGACDGVISFRRNRKEQVGKLLVTGRDMEEREVDVRWDGESSRWVLEDEEKRSEERQEILDLLHTLNQPTQPTTLATMLNKPVNNVRRLLFKMKHAGEVNRVTAGYIVGSEKDAKNAGVVG